MAQSSCYFPLPPWFFPLPLGVLGGHTPFLRNSFVVFCLRVSILNHLLVHWARYLQQQASPTSRAIWDYHFFNTYFYNKLKEAVSYKVFLSLSLFTFHNSNSWFQLLLLKTLFGCLVMPHCTTRLSN